MTLMQRVVKPRNQRSKRALEAREPKAIENTKSALFLRGLKCSDKVLKCMKDLYLLKKPAAEFYSKKNDIRPFEDATPIERFAKKHDYSLFVFGNQNKKRPDNMIIGRMYDYHLLDMVEFGVENFKGLSDFPGEKVAAEIKPCLMFSGAAFDENPDFVRVKSLLIDFFRGPQVTNIRLQGLEHALQFTAVDDKILLRSYRIVLKKSGQKNPRVELEEIGPSADLVVRRTHLASDDLFKTATKKVKNVLKTKKVKNIEKDVFGSTLGRIHVPAQKVGEIQTRKMKGLKESVDEKKQKKKELMEAKKAKAELIRKQNVENVFADEDEGVQEMDDE